MNPIEPSPTPPAQPSSPRIFAIRVLGVGGAGCNAVEQMCAQDLLGVEFGALNTDQAALHRMSCPRRVLVGARVTRGLGAGGEPERGRAAAEEDAGAIRQLCEGADLVFVVAGMGGGTGTGAAPVVARIAREAGALVVALVVTPFECEGIQRQRKASTGLKNLRATADSVICLPNQRVLKMIDEKTTLLETFRLTNDLVAQGIQGIWRILARPGLINVDFADLCSVLRGGSCDGSLASSEARGENRLGVVLEKLLAHPLIDGGTRLANAGQILVSISGGPDLTTRDVNQVMEQLRRHAEHAHLILGTAIEEDQRDRLSVTVVASGFADPGNGSRGGESPAAGVIVAMEPGDSGAAAEAEPLLRETDLDQGRRPPSRFIAPPPESTPEMINAMARQSPSHGRRKPAVWKQETLNLEIASKGRFERSAPTIHRGQDLDIPTFVRRGVVLN